MLDIFNGDAFSVTSLTDSLRNAAHRPSRLGDMGLFKVSSVNTLTVAIERIGDTLQLVAPSPRGGAGETRDDCAIGQRANLARAVFHHDIANRDLAISGHSHDTVTLHAKDRRRVHRLSEATRS